MLQALQNIAKVLKDRPVDVVLYLDRLDVYRVEHTDQDIMSALSNTLGPQIWKNAVIGLTHGKAVAPPGTTLGTQLTHAVSQCWVLQEIHKIRFCLLCDVLHDRVQGLMQII